MGIILSFYLTIITMTMMTLGYPSSKQLLVTLAGIFALATVALASDDCKATRLARMEKPSTRWTGQDYSHHKRSSASEHALIENPNSKMQRWEDYELLTTVKNMLLSIERQYNDFN